MPDFRSFLAAEGNETTFARPCHAHKGYEYIGRTIIVSITLVRDIGVIHRAALPSRKTFGLVVRLDGLLSLRPSRPTIVIESAH